MRVNVYGEEITQECGFIIKEVKGRRFYGIRVALESPRELHHSEGDDDRSAVTFWVPWSGGSSHHEITIGLFNGLLAAAWNARRHDEAHFDMKGGFVTKHDLEEKGGDIMPAPPHAES